MEDTDSRKPKPVTYRFKNIGPVKEAELELGDFTVIAGHNNTGKTYIVYTLYGFLKGWEDWPYAEDFMLDKDQDQFPPIRSIVKKLREEGKAKFPIDRDTLKQQRHLLIQEVARDFSSQALPAVFSSQNEDFKGSFIEIKFNEGIHIDIPPPIKENTEKVDLLIEYDGNNVVFTSNTREQRSHMEYYISNHYFLFLLRDQFPDPFILSAERFGISLFYKELDFTKNQLVDLLQKMGDDKSRDRVSPYLLIDRTTSRYALPIKDNIDYTRSIPDLLTKKSTLHEHRLFDDIKDMMGGYYGTSGDDIRFISKARGKERSFNIPLHLASSSSRGLSDFYFFLRHVARSNHLLIIDEPESHLDTANQIQLARLLARFVRAGLKVLITTHSDYFIKEINNLVMLSRPFADKDSVMKKFKYGKDDFLEPESIRAYVAERNGLTRCTVDHFGIDMPVFDETIDEINKVANELSSRLMDDAEA